MTESVKKTISHAGIYGAGLIIQRSISIIMLPIYTRFLSPDEYGVVSLLTVATEVASDGSAREGIDGSGQTAIPESPRGYWSENEGLAG